MAGKEDIYVRYLHQLFRRCDVRGDGLLGKDEISELCDELQLTDSQYWWIVDRLIGDDVLIKVSRRAKKPVSKRQTKSCRTSGQFLCHKLFTCLFNFIFPLSLQINRLILMISSVCSSSYSSRKGVGTMKRKAHVKKMTAKISCLNGLRNAGLIRDQEWVVDPNHRQESRLVQKQLFTT